MDAAYINYRDPIAQDELLLNHFLDSLNLSRLSSHMQGFELFLNNFSIHLPQALIMTAGLVFSTYTAPRHWGRSCCFDTGHAVTEGVVTKPSRWCWLHFYCDNCKLLPALLIVRRSGWSQTTVYHSGTRENVSLGVVSSNGSCLSPNRAACNSHSGVEAGGGVVLECVVCFAQTRFLVADNLLKWKDAGPHWRLCMTFAVPSLHTHSQHRCYTGSQNGKWDEDCIPEEEGKILWIHGTVLFRALSGHWKEIKFPSIPMDETFSIVALISW